MKNLGERIRELRDAKDLRPSPVALQCVTQRILDLPPVFQVAHVDEVIDDHAAQVTKT